MAKYVTPALTADGRSQVIRLYSARSGGDSIKRTTFVEGSFGGGTATLQVSSDKGVTWVNVTNDAGTAITFTEAGVRELSIASDAQAPVLVSIDLVGSTTPSVVLTIFDNR